jgi:hypothetical protein
MSLRTGILLVAAFICASAWWLLWPSDQVLASRLDLNSEPFPGGESFLVFRSDEDVQRHPEVTIPDSVRMHLDFNRHDVVRICWMAPLTLVRSSRSVDHSIPYYPDLRVCSTFGGTRIHFLVTQPPVSLLGTEMSSTFSARTNVAWYAVPKEAHVQMGSSGLVWSEVYLTSSFVMLILLVALGRKSVVAMCG